MKNKIVTINQYQTISADVWKIFKKYYPAESNTDTFADDIHALDEKYKGTDGYEFMQKLMKVYFQELNKIKG